MIYSTNIYWVPTMCHTLRCALGKKRWSDSGLPPIELPARLGRHPCKHRVFSNTMWTARTLSPGREQPGQALQGHWCRSWSRKEEVTFSFCSPLKLRWLAQFLVHIKGFIDIFDWMNVWFWNMSNNFRGRNLGKVHSR